MLWRSLYIHTETFDSRSGPMCLMVTFHQRAILPKNRIIPSLLKLNIDTHWPALVRVKSVYSSLTKCCHLNCLTLLSHCKSLKTSNTVAEGCQSTEHREVCVASPECGEQCPNAWLTFEQICAHDGNYKHSLTPLSVHGQLNACVFWYKLTQRMQVFCLGKCKAVILLTDSEDSSRNGC